MLCVACVRALVCLRACARRLEQVPAHLPWCAHSLPACSLHPRQSRRLCWELRRQPPGSPRPVAGPPLDSGLEGLWPHPAPAGPAPPPGLVRNPAQLAQLPGEKPTSLQGQTSSPHGRGGRKRLPRVSGCLMVLTLESVGPEPHCWVRTRAPPLSYSGSLPRSPKPLSLSFPVCETGTMTASAELSAERLTGPLEVRGLVAAPSTGGGYAHVSSADT